MSQDEQILTTSTELLLSLEDMTTDQRGSIVSRTPRHALRVQMGMPSIDVNEYGANRGMRTAAVLLERGAAVEQFLAMVGVPMPSRGAAEEAEDELANEKAIHQTAMDRQAQHSAAEMAKLTGKIQLLEASLTSAADQAQVWRNFAVALKADVDARGFAVSKKTLRLDPRKA